MILGRNYNVFLSDFHMGSWGRWDLTMDFDHQTFGDLMDGSGYVRRWSFQ
jgi:hypothetical protein